MRRVYISGLMNFPNFAEVWETDKSNSMFTRAFVAEMDQAGIAAAPTFLGGPVAQSVAEKNA